MSDCYQLPKTSIYSEYGSKREDACIDASYSNAVSNRWKSILRCCLRNSRKRNKSLPDYNPDEYDCIIEKLVVKRIPLALYATPHDYFERNKDGFYFNNKSIHNPSVDTTNNVSVLPEVKSTLYYTKSRTYSNLSSNISNKNLRFDKREDVLDEDAIPTTSSAHEMSLEQKLRNAEILNQFSALHPDLKESERPPKDPCPLNLLKSKRSLAESISEVASAKPYHNPSFRTKPRSKSNNVYIAPSIVSREMSTMATNEEIPTHDKNHSLRTFSTSPKIGSTSCMPHCQKDIKIPTQKSDNHRNNIQFKEFHSNFQYPRKSQDYPSSSKKNKYIVSPLQVHYVSPNIGPPKKKSSTHENELDSTYVQEQNNIAEVMKVRDSIVPSVVESVTDEASLTSDDLRNDELSGTTLRWKIIIKHHQPDTSSTTHVSLPDLEEGLKTHQLTDARKGAIQGDAQFIDKYTNDQNMRGTV